MKVIHDKVNLDEQMLMFWKSTKIKDQLVCGFNDENIIHKTSFLHLRPHLRFITSFLFE
jgi:hypothetical protein